MQRSDASTDVQVDRALQIYSLNSLIVPVRFVVRSLPKTTVLNGCASVLMGSCPFRTVVLKLEQCSVEVLVSVYDCPATAVDGEAISKAGC